MRSAPSPAHAPAQVRLSLLGAFRLQRVRASGSELLDLPTRKDKSLLAYLALHPEAHSREHMAALLWGDYPDEKARRSLRMALSDLRKELGNDLLLTDRETVQLNPEYPLLVDAVAFSQMTHRVSQKTTDDFAISDLLAAISAYRGDLLADFYDDWIIPLRDEYRAAYLDALLKVVEHYRAQSDYAKAIEFAQRILTTDVANEQAHQHLMFCYAALGERKAALEQYEACQRALRDELGVEPSKETKALFATIRQQTETRSPAARMTNLPQPLTSFVGREKEVREIRELIAHRSLLITLVGAGGSGKTRLAIELGRELVSVYGDGVWWVDLSPLTNEALVPQQVAKALGVQEQPQQELIETLVEFLRGKQLLLVLDNCEHLIAACAQVAEKLLSADTNLQVLATSREALGIGGETVWQVPTLAVPDEHTLSKLLMQYEAIRLFFERARAVNPHFELTEQNAAAVARICQRLDGIPLAIELAVARVPVLSPEQIAARLDDRFNLLTTGSRTALPRQQTLRALIDWSYELLTAEEKLLFGRLSVFAGGWTLEAAEAVCGDEEDAGSAVLDLLTHLIHKSLVVVEGGGAAPRYRMLETIREYAREKLEAAGESARMRTEHLAYFMNLASEAEPQIKSREQVAWLDRLETEMDNLRAALSWSEPSSAAEQEQRLAGALIWFWLFRNHVREGRDWQSRALNAGEGLGRTAARAKALFGSGVMAYEQGDFASAQAALDQSIKMCREVGDKQVLAYALVWRGWIEVARRNLDDASLLFGESLDLARSMGDPWAAAHALSRLQFLAALRLNFGVAWAYGEEAVTLFRQVGDTWGLAWALWRLGYGVSFFERDFARGQILLEESLSLARQWDNKKLITDTLRELGNLALNQFDAERAKSLIQEALTLGREMGFKESIFIATNALGAAARLEGNFAQASAYYMDAIRLGREAGTKRFIVPAMNLGFVRLQENDYWGAANLFTDSMKIVKTMQDKTDLGMCLTGYGAAAGMAGRLEQGVRLLGAADALFASPLDSIDRMEFDHYLAAARAQLDETAFAKAWAEGRALTWEQAVAQAEALALDFG